jgi:hypothetical protein
MGKILMILACLCSLMFVGCGVQEEDLPTILTTTTDSDADVDTETPAEEHADVSLCNVNIRFVFKHGEGTEVQFENGNDATAIVTVENDTTGGLVVQNCLWADGEDNEPASFQKGENLLVTVQLGEGQFLQWTCVDALDDLLGIFPVCDDMLVVIQ